MVLATFLTVDVCAKESSPASFSSVADEVLPIPPISKILTLSSSFIN